MLSHQPGQLRTREAGRLLCAPGHDVPQAAFKLDRMPARSCVMAWPWAAIVRRTATSGSDRLIHDGATRTRNRTHGVLQHTRKMAEFSRNNQKQEVISADSGTLLEVSRRWSHALGLLGLTGHTTRASGTSGVTPGGGTVCQTAGERSISGCPAAASSRSVRCFHNCRGSQTVSVSCEG